MTASDSSSSAAAPLEPRRVDLLSAGLLPPLPTAFLGGNDLALLEPLRFLAPEALPDAPQRLVDRAALAHGLESANESYGHPEAARLAAKLADPATRVVVTGQQPGLFGGPLYTLSKAVAAVRWAERIEAAGGSAVAVFWVATEDHDFREVSRAAFLAADGPRAFDLGEDAAPLLPVGMRSFGPGIETLLEALREAMPGDRFAQWTETLARWYRPEARFGEAFSRLLVHLLGGRAPLMLDAMLPAVKEAQRPWLRRLVACRDALDEAFAGRDAEIVQQGYELQVRPQPGASPLFLLHGQERRRVEWRPGERLVLRGGDGAERGVAWLLETIEENPGVVSPGVLARAPVQDAILGTALQVLGPGELSYMPQAAPVYRLLDIEAPWVALRPQMLVLEPRQLEQLDAVGLDLADLIAAQLDLDGLLAAGEDEALLAPARQQLAALLEDLRVATEGVDASLVGPWKKTAAQMERALDIFGGKLTGSLARRAETARRRTERLRDTVRPLDGLQERIVSTAHFPGKYGERFVAACFEQLELDPANLQVVRP